MGEEKHKLFYKGCKPFKIEGVLSPSSIEGKYFLRNCKFVYNLVKRDEGYEILNRFYSGVNISEGQEENKKNLKSMLEGPVKSFDLKVLLD
jgi:hypothetical protein